jgi:D-alanine-D-alanine ligase
MAAYRVGVIFGGRSVEHDVSIITAHQAMAALVERHDVMPIYITREGRWLTGPKLNDLDVYRSKSWDEVGEDLVLAPVPQARPPLQPKKTGLRSLLGNRTETARLPLTDVVIPAIHGTFGEDGTLQGLLELADLPYTGSGVVASAVGMDKAVMKSVFRAAGLPCVPDVIVDGRRFENDRDAVLDGIEAELGYPVFAKPVKAGSSVGIAKATDRSGLLEALEIAHHYDTRVLVEKSMEGCVEINCSVLGGGTREPRVSVCEQPIPWQEFLSFEDKYLRGGKEGRKGSDPEGMAALDRRIPAPIPDGASKQIQENAISAFRSIGASGVARVDSFYNEASGETWVMEINTTPGSFAFYLWEASGLGFEKLLDEMIEIALEEHAAKSSLTFTFDSTLLESKPKGKTGG